MATAIENRMTRSGFCEYVSPGSHVCCDELKLRCDCPCHSDIDAYDDGRRIGERPPDEIDEEPDET